MFDTDKIMLDADSVRNRIFDTGKPKTEFEMKIYRTITALMNEVRRLRRMK